MEKHDVVAINWPMGVAYYIEKQDKLYFWKELLCHYSRELKDILDEKWYYDSPREPSNQLEIEFDK